MNKIWAIILAAGESKRMGFPKMLLDFGGKSMLERVIENIIASGINNIVIVLGAEKDRLTGVVSKYPVKTCYNENYAEGMLSSVKCGFRNIFPGYEAALIFQGDQPYIYPEVINLVVDAYRSAEHGLIIPVCNGKRGHPLLIDRRYNDEIELLDSSVGLRSLACKFSYDVLEVETVDAGILKDFDTYGDYTEINKHMKYERKD